MMDRKKYLLAVYLVVAGIAVILGLIGINNADGSLKDILINLSTEFLGVVLIFFLVNRLFLVDEMNTNSRIDSLLQRIEADTTSIRGIENNESLEKLLANRKVISLLGWSMITPLSRHSSALIHNIKNGASVRIVVIDPESTARELLRTPNRITHSFDAFCGYVSDIQKEVINATGSFEIRVLNWIPSCSLVLLDPLNADGYTRVTIYPPLPSAPVGERAHFLLSSTHDKRWHSSYVNQFEKIWEMATPLALPAKYQATTK